MKREVKASQRLTVKTRRRKRKRALLYLLMNDERRVAEDASIVPLWGNVATIERTQRAKRRVLRRSTTFPERRGRRSFFEDLALKPKNA